MGIFLELLVDATIKCRYFVVGDSTNKQFYLIDRCQEWKPYKACYQAVTQMYRIPPTMVISPLRIHQTLVNPLARARVGRSTP